MNLQEAIAVVLYLTDSPEIAAWNANILREAKAVIGDEARKTISHWQREAGR